MFAEPMSKEFCVFCNAVTFLISQEELHVEKHDLISAMFLYLQPELR